MYERNNDWFSGYGDYTNNVSIVQNKSDKILGHINKFIEDQVYFKHWRKNRCLFYYIGIFYFFVQKNMP